MPGERLPAKYEDKKTDFPVKDFLGVNTQAERTAISENEFAWLENLMPIGYGNLKCVPFQGAAFATLGVTVTYWKYANIANTDYLMCFSSDGSARQVNLTTFAVTVIGAAATFVGQVAMAQWKNDRILIVASNNYWDWNGAALTVLGGTTGAPTAGSTIATFAGRVWIGNNRTVFYSGPDSYTDFQGASFGGNFIITDETLTSTIKHLATANNFLYVFGISSINAVSDVRVSGAATLFSNVNITAQVGTDLRMSVFAYFRTVAFSTRYGVYGLFGSTPQKMSDPLDGFFDGIDFSLPISGGVVNLFKILCGAFLFQYNDPHTGAMRPLLAIYFNKKWFFGSQGNSLTLVASGFISGVPALFGTDGTNIYRLFSDTGTDVHWEFRSALWAMKRPTRTKQALKAGLELTTGAIPTDVSLSVDTEVSSISQTLSSTNTGEWFNAAGTLGQWQNAALTLGDWIASGFLIYQQDFQTYGRYIGLAGEGDGRGFSINGLLAQYEDRANWAASGTT